MLTKYVIIIYTLGSVLKNFGVWIKAVPKSLQRRNSRPGYAKRTAKGLFTWARLTGLARYILGWISPWVRLRVVPHFSSGRVERTKRERAWKSSPFLEWGDFHARSRFVRSINIPEEKWGTTRSLGLGSYEKFQPGFPRREKVRDPREEFWRQIRETKQTL